MSSGINAINFDMSDFAEQIEFDLRRYLKDPEPGIYYGRSRKPFMKPHASESAHIGKRYFRPFAVYDTDSSGGTLVYPAYQVVTYTEAPKDPLALKTDPKKPKQSKSTPVASIEDLLKLNGDVHNHEGEIVLRKPAGGFTPEDFHLRPIVSTIGYDVIRGFMDYLIDSHVKFKKNSTALIGFVEQYFKIDECVGTWVDEEKAKNPTTVPRSDIYRLDLTLHIEEMLRQIMSPITDEVAKFIATDPWFIYIQRSRNSHDVVVYKTQDYRISEWTRLKEEGKI